jgi:hypothetical protein
MMIAAKHKVEKEAKAKLSEEKKLAVAACKADALAKIGEKDLYCNK